MTDLKAINGRDGGPPATVEQIAALEFKAVSRLAAMPERKRMENMQALAQHVYNAAVIAMDIVTHDKDALVKMVAEKHDEIGPWLMGLADAAGDARALRDIITSGETRLAVALAIVEGDDPDPPDGDDDGKTVAA